jgi:hypothetical protein
VILFKRGEVWREKLIVSSSGSSGSRIIFGAYGSGDDPQILGSIGKSSSGDWTREAGGSFWYASVPAGPNIAWRNDLALSRVANKADLNSSTEWWWDAANRRAYVWSDGGINPADRGGANVFEFPQRDTCISPGVNVDYIEWQDLELRYSNQYGLLTYTGNTYLSMNRVGSKHHYKTGMYFNGGSNHSIRNCMIYDTGNMPDVPDPTTAPQTGIFLANVNTAQIEGTHVSYTGRAGICVWGSISANITITNNDVSHPGLAGSHAYGVQIYGSTSADINNVLIQNNYIHDCGHANIYLINRITNLRIFYNLLVNGGTLGSGDYLGNLSGNGDGAAYAVVSPKIYNNVFYQSPCNVVNRNNVRISSYLYLEAADFKNNIFYNGNTNSMSRTYGSDHAHKIPPTLNYNCHYSANSGNLLSVEGVVSTWAGRPTGIETSGKNSNPLFAAAGDFKLQSGSPCIEAGTNVGLTRDYAGNQVPQGSAPEIGAYEIGSSGSDTTPPSQPAHLRLIN